MILYDAVILTDSRYVAPEKVDGYVRNVLNEDAMLLKALEKKGMRTFRTNWDNPDFDWASTLFIIFRSTWDYFERYPEFSAWLDKTNNLTGMINPYETIRWNIDKHYLNDLKMKGIPIPPTLFIEPGEKRNLRELAETYGWKEIILKPAVSGGARHTYRINGDEIDKYESIFSGLIREEAMLIQEFQPDVLENGELTYMVFAGKYSHAVLKKAKPGDFRVQDDFGGSVHDHIASDAEIEFAERAVSACDPLPVYARVDVIRNRENQPCVSEIELIEPELWFRKRPAAADLFAEACLNYL